MEFHGSSCNIKLIHNTNFDAPDAHFDYLILFSGTLAEKVGNPKKKINKAKCINEQSVKLSHESV
jgi:hypothetical protein